MRPATVMDAEHEWTTCLDTAGTGSRERRPQWLIANWENRETAPSKRDILSRRGRPGILAAADGPRRSLHRTPVVEARRIESNDLWARRRGMTRPAAVNPGTRRVRSLT